MELRRGVDPNLLQRISRGCYPVLFAFIDWPGAPVYAHTAVGPIAFNGNIYDGVGNLGNVSIPPEAGEIAAVEATLSLAGVPADLDGYADDAIRNHEVRIYMGALEGRPGGDDGTKTAGPGNTLVGTPTQLFSGIMDGLTLTAGATDGGVEHEAQVSLITGVEARSSATIYHSDEDQKAKYPDDTAGRLVILAYAKAQKLTWPES